MIKEKEVKHVFLEAMLKESWAARNYPKGRTINQLPGSIVATDVVINKFKVLDYFFVNKINGNSNGTTLILYDDCIIWEMNYWGNYNEEESEFIKDVLFKTYSDRKFYGGRGYSYWDKNKKLMYNNEIWPNLDSDVDDSLTLHGIETIHNLNGVESNGFHKYNARLY